MAIFKIPVRNDLPAYEFRIDLDNSTYNLSFRYNDRMSLWIMDIMDAEKTPLRMGIPVQTAVNLMSILKKDNYPAGDFIAIHETSEYIDADREAFGETIDLYYLEEGELEENE